MVAVKDERRVFPTSPKWPWNVFVLILIGYFALIAYWSFWPYVPIVVDCPIKILNPGKRVKAGDDLIYQITYVKKMDITGKLTRKLVNDYKIDLRDADATADVGPDKDKIKIKVPSYADAGRYRLHWCAKYQVNPLRIVSVSAQSEEFEVYRDK